MGNKPKVAGIVRFYSETYPRIFRELWPQTLLAFAIFAVTGVAAFILTMRDPTFAHRLLGTHMMETIEKREMWTHSIVTIKPLAASSIMTNNLSVAFATFAFGITAGIGTVWMMVLNGLLIGVIGAATWQAGMAGQLWTFRGSPRRAGTACNFHRRRRGIRDCSRHVVSGTPPAARIARAGGRTSCAVVAGDDPDADRSWSNRGFSFAVGNSRAAQILVRCGDVCGACDVPHASATNPKAGRIPRVLRFP